MTRTLALLAAAAAVLALPAPAAAEAPIPPGFFGISPQTTPSSSDLELMGEAGVTSVRLPLFWVWSQPSPPRIAPPDWSEFDQSVQRAAEHGIRVFAFVWGTPDWVAPQPTVEPVETPRARAAWASFLRMAVRRYGPHGAFWAENPTLPYLPIRDWEIWNEENIVSFSRPTGPARFARLLRIAGRVLHGADPGAQVIIGGLFGRPLQVPPNVSSAGFLEGVYRAGGVKGAFDGVALHPYVADAGVIPGQILRLRRVMRVNGDAGTPLYVSELGWGSDSFDTRWERGMRGQARELNTAFAMLAEHRLSWRIGGVWWFTWADANAHCQFCDSAGLLTEEDEGKPAWYAFNAWTGGDPYTVPRAASAE